MSTVPRSWVWSTASILTLHVAVSLFMETGHLTEDEGTYHMMVANLAKRGTLEIWNGYEEMPSPELEVGWLVAREGRLFPSYPVLFAVAALPFYWSFGFPGLFVLNNLAFLAAVLLTGVLAFRLFGGARLAFASAAILGLATYFWEYSQAASPHALATASVVGAFLAGVCALQGQDPSSTRRWAFVAGLVGSLGIGIRLDVALVLPCLVVPFLFSEPRRLGAAISAMIVGAIPGLTALSYANAVRFGDWAPLSYGLSMPSTRLGSYLPIVALGSAVALGAWLARRTRMRRLLQDRRIKAFSIFLALTAIFFLPQARELAGRMVRGGYQLIFDLRVMDLEVSEPGLSRSPGGGLLYIRHFKKALLQSCPYLTILVLPALTLFRARRHRFELGALFLVPGIFIATYSYSSWHGGLCLNLRYWTPVLPFLSILTAYALRELWDANRAAARRVALLGGAAALTAHLLFTRVLPQTVEQQELSYLTLPLVLSGLLAVATVASAVAGRRSSMIPRIAAGAAVSGLVWAFLVAFLYDYPATRALREYNRDLGRLAAESVAGDALFFSDWLDPFWNLIEADRVRLASPTEDEYADFRPLIHYHLNKGRRVYAAFGRDVWSDLDQAGFLEDLQVELQWASPDFSLGRIRREPSAVESHSAGTGRLGPFRTPSGGPAAPLPRGRVLLLSTKPPSREWPATSSH